MRKILLILFLSFLVSGGLLYAEQNIPTSTRIFNGAKTGYGFPHEVPIDKYSPPPGSKDLEFGFCFRVKIAVLGGHDGLNYSWQEFTDTTWIQGFLLPNWVINGVIYFLLALLLFWYLLYQLNLKREKKLIIRTQV